MILLKYENETTCGGAIYLPLRLCSLHVSYGSFLHECAKIFRYISAQINIYIHSVRGRHLRITGKFGGAAVFKVRTMWDGGNFKSKQNLIRTYIPLAIFCFSKIQDILFQNQPFIKTIFNYVIHYVIHYIIVTHYIVVITLNICLN